MASNPNAAQQQQAATQAALTPRHPTPARNRIQQGNTPNWIESPEIWDELKLQVNGQVQPLPGIVKIKGKLGRKVDINSAPGSDGARLRDKGYEPAKFTVVLRLWTPDQFTKWRNLNTGMLALRAVNKRTALQIVHPALNILGIQFVYLESISILSEGTPRGVWETELSFIQFLPPTRRPLPPVTGGTLGQQPVASGFQGQNQQSSVPNPTSPANRPSATNATRPPSAVTRPPR